MSKSTKQYKMPTDLHERLVSLDQKVVERFGPPPNYRRGGPGAALHAGTALLEQVLSGKQCIVPADQMAEYEAGYVPADQLAEYKAAYQAAGVLRTKNALFSTMLLTVAMGWARDQGAEDPDARASAIVSETLRRFCELEILEAEAEAEPQAAEALRQIARTFLDDAERLSTRARAATAKEVAQ